MCDFTNEGVLKDYLKNIFRKLMERVWQESPQKQ